MDCNDVSLELVNIKCANNFEQERKYISTHCLSSAKLIKAVGRYILPRLSKSNDAFIINSYLPKLQEIKLQLALLQCPQLWESPKLNSMHFDIEMRKKFKVESVCYTGFEQFVRDLLTDTIPICFLEGYSNLQQQVKSLQWPSKPKFIFTSNNFDTDEIFKAWVGQKVEQEIPYFTGQHGNYQAYPALLNAPEMVSSDKFFTWGWSSESMKNIPAFIFKIANRPRHTTPDGGLLLIELHAPHLLNATDCYYEFGVYQEQQFRFVEALPEKIQKELTVRLHGSWHNTRWSDDKRWNDRIPSVKLEPGHASIQKLIAKSRLVVHSYDSTGILECLASNTPTLCFWNGGLEHLLPNEKPYYELLREAGIIADSPEHASLLVSKYWDDIDGWWKSERVQNARMQFCNQYARVEKKPVMAIKRLLCFYSGCGS
jgi:putative transferase (TIGR04331 family)